MADITLSSAVRTNLLALQNTASLLGTTQERLSTGLKVNSALDDPTAFFTASSLSSRAGDLNRLQDFVGNAVQTISAADAGISAITDLVESAEATARQALQTSDATERATLATQFDEIRTQIDELAADAGFNGVNLLDGDNLTVTFNEDGTSTLDVTGVTFDSAGLSITGAVGSFALDADINTAIGELSAATSTLRSQAATFGSNLSVVETRQDFTRNLINVLETGAANLTLADTNEEGANLLALQTRQQLSSTALSLASQADQNVLRLF